MTTPAGGMSERPSKQMTRRTLDAMAWSSAGAVAQTVMQLAVLLILARLLTPSDFGVVGAATLVLGFTQIFWQLGVGPAIIQRPELTRAHLETAFTTSIILGLVFGAAIYLVAPSLAAFFDIGRLTDVLRVTTIVYLLGGLILVAQSLLRRELRFRQIAVIQLSAYAAYAVVAITAAILDAGVWSLVAGLLAQAVTEAAMVLAMQPHSKRLGLHRSVLRELLSFGSGVTMAQISNYIALQGDNFVTARVLGAGPLGLYGRAYGLMTMPANLFSSAVDTVMLPAMSKVQAEPQRLASAFKRSLAVTAVIGMPLGSLTFVLAPEIVTIALGDQWSGAVPALRILGLGMFFRIAYKLGASVARAKGRVHRIAWRQTVYAVAVVGGSWVGAETLGLEGVAIAVLGALALIFVLLTQLGMWVTGVTLREMIAVHLPGLALAVVTFAGAASSAALLREAGAPALVTAAGTTLVTFGVIVVLSRWKPGVFLGEDGGWGIKTLGGYVRGRLPKIFQPTPRLSVQSPASGMDA